MRSEFNGVGRNFYEFFHIERNRGEYRWGSEREGEWREESGIPPWEHFDIVRSRPRRSLSISVVSWVTTRVGLRRR